MTDNDELLQRARDIVAETYLKAQMAHGKKPSHYATYKEYFDLMTDYAKYMRQGAYDDELTVQAVLAALTLEQTT